MGKTRRKERLVDDSHYELEGYISDAFNARKKRDKKRKQPQHQGVPAEEDFYQDEDYGSFEKIGKRK